MNGKDARALAKGDKVRWHNDNGTAEGVVVENGPLTVAVLWDTNYREVLSHAVLADVVCFERAPRPAPPPPPPTAAPPPKAVPKSPDPEAAPSRWRPDTGKRHRA